MITPAKLKSGDKVGIIAPARKIDMDDIRAAISVFEKWGLIVELGENIFLQHRQFAGTDAQRAQDLQTMIDNPEIKAIFCARGGYGTVRVLPLIDFSNLKRHPKWIVGFSDITALHTLVNQSLGVVSVHGMMPYNFPADMSENSSVNSLKKVLFGDTYRYNVKVHEFNRSGKCSGILVGGNLSVLYSLSGTKYDMGTRDKILVLEDLDEYLYHIDRMLKNLKYAGKLEGLKGLIVGGMTDMNDNKVPFGQTAYEIIQESVMDYGYPVCYGFPVGHTPSNFALRLGAPAELMVDKNECVFTGM